MAGGGRGGRIKICLFTVTNMTVLELNRRGCC